MRTNFIHKNYSTCSLKVILAVCFFVFGIGFETKAATYYSIASGLWNSNNTWSLTTNGAAVGAGVFPIAGDNVIIERNFTVTVSANAACATLQIGSPGNFGAGTLTFSGAFSVSVSGGMNVGGYGNPARTGTINFANGSGITATSLTFGRANPTPGTPNAINMTSGGTLTVGSLVVNTAGPIVNNWTPGSGTVVLNATNTLPNSVFTSFNNLTINGGTTTLGQSVSIAGTLNVNAGSFALGANNVTSVGAVTLNGTSITGSGTLTLAGDVTNTAAGSVATISTAINLNGATRTFNINDNVSAVPDLLISGIISGSGGIIKLGTGSMNLGAVDSYSGSTSVNAGILRIATSGGAIPDGSALAVVTTLDLNGNDEVVGSITGGGTITSSAVGNMTLTTGGDNTSTTFSGIIQNGSATLVSIVKNGSGTLTLSGANTYTGGTLLNAGGLNINNSNALGASTGAFTIVGGTINNTSAGALTLANYPQAWNGDFTFGGTQSLNLGSGPVTLTGNRQVTVNASTLAVGGIVSGGFNLTKAGAGTLNLGSNPVTLNSLIVNAGTLTSTSGTLSIATSLTVAGTFNHNNGTVNYNGASQNIADVTYNNLTINQSGGEALLAGNAVVSGTLTLGSRNLNLNGFNLTLGSSAPAVAGGAFSSSKMIIAVGSSEIRKVFSGPGSYSFPIGDNTGTFEYSPISVNVNAGTFGSPYVGVSVVDGKHPNNASSTHFLSRYWNVTNSGITNATISATYLPADINGTEASIKGAQLNGIFNQTTNGWTKYTTLGGNTLTATNTPLTSGQLSSFTGITGANPTVSITGGGVSICNGGSVPLTASVTGGDPTIIYSWTPITGLSSGTVSNPTTAPTVTTPYTVSIIDGNGILATSAPSTITVDQAATVSLAGGDQNVCGTLATLAANVPSTGTGLWSFAPGGNPDALPLSAFSNTALASSTFTGTSGLTYILTWTISNGACTASADDVQITLDQSPSTADAGLASITQCNTSTFLMNATVPAIGIGTWTVFSGTATITNSTSATTTITGITAGNTATLRWTVANGSCAPVGNFDDIILTNSATAPAANAGSDQTLCTTSSFTLSGNAPTPGSGLWTYVSGFAGVAITTPGSNVSTVTGLTAGNSVTLRWTISNGVCGSTQDDVTLTNQAAPSTADAGLASITQCNTSTFLMNATVPAIGIGTWTVFSGTATITNSTSATTTITGITAGNTATLRWTVANGSCAPVGNFDDIILTNSATAPAANAGSDQTLCTTSSFTLSGNAPTPGSGLWTYVSGFAGVAITTPGSNVSTVTGLTAGNSVTLRWTISNGVCGSTQDDVTLTNQAAPSTADAGLASITQCNTSTFLMNATVPAIGIGTWTVFSGTATITNSTSATTTITGITAGNTATLRWTVANGSCAPVGNFDDIILTNSATAPAANAGSDQTLCTTSSFTLSGNAPTPGSGLWTYVSGFAGVAITTPGSNVSTVTGLTAGNSVTLRWTISNGVCGSTQDDVTLTNQAAPSTADAGLASITQCNTSTFLMNATVPAIGMGTWTVFSGTATITNSTSATTTITGITAGNTATLRWTVANGSCAPVGNFDDIILTNSATAPAANAGSDQTLCTTSSFTLSGNAPTPGSGLWTYVSGFAGVAITTPGSNVSTVTGLTAGNSVTLRWTISNGVCGSTQDDVTLTNQAAPSTADAGLASITQCNTSTFLMNATVPAIGMGTWTVFSGTATITNSTSATTTITGITAGNTATLRWTVANGSCAPVGNFDDIILTNNAAVPVANAGLDQTLCNTSTFTLAGSVASPGTGSWVIQSGPGTVTTPSSPSSTVTGVTAGGPPTVIRWTVTNGACGGFDEVTIINNVDPFVTVPSNQSLCAGLTTTPVSFSGNAAQYNWTNNQPSIGLPASGVGNIGAFTALNSTGSPIVATILITPTSGICTGIQQSFSYTISPLPVINPIANIATGTGVVVGPILLTANTSGGETFTWTGGSAVGLANGSGSSPIPSFTTTNTGVTPISSVISVSAVKSGCPGPVTNFNVTVYPIPGALAGDQNICTGEYSSVLITGIVAGTTFTWTVGTVTGTVSGQGPGSGSVIAQQLTSVAGGVVEYIIIPTANGVQGPPTPVRVGVLAVPLGNSVSAGTHVTCSGTSLNITPTSSVAGATFAWTGDNGSGGSGDITDTPINSTNNPIDVTYTLIPTGPGPTFCVGSPFTIVVTVNPNPSFTATNSTPTICSGVSTNILFNSSTTGHQINVVSVSYNGAGGGTVVPGTTTFANGNILTEALTNSTSAPIDVVYTFNVTTPSSSPVCPLVPVNQVVTVRVYPVPNALASSQSICSGSSSNVVITNPNAVAGTTFSWTLGTVTGTVSGQSAGSGTTISQTLTSALGGSVQYIITPIANGCPGTPLAPITVTVNPIPVGNSVAAGTHVICSGTSLNITPTLSVGSGTFTWSGSNGSGGSGNITDAPVNTTNSAINITYTVTPKGLGTTFCVGSPFTIVVTVNPNPSFTATNSAPTICSGVSTNILFNSSTTGHQINVVSVSYNGAGGGTVVPGTTTFANGNILTEALTNSTSAPIDVVYTFNVTTPSSSPVCPLVPVNQVVTVRVYPVPNALASSQSICSGSSSNVVITNPNAVAGTTFSWTLGTVTGTVSGQSAGSGTTISQTLTSALGGSVQYIITPIANGCPGTPLAPITVTVNPIPVGNSVAAGTHVICSGTSLNIVPTSNVAGATFTWSGSNGSGGSGNITDAPVNTTNSAINITYTVTPKGLGTTFCVGSPFTIVVTVNPNPSFTATNSTPTICSGVSTNILFNSSTTGHQINVVSVSYNGAGGGTVVPGTTTFANGNILTEALTNSTSAPIDVVYTFNVTTPSSSPVCPLVPVNQVVTVRVYPVPNALASSQSICSGSSSNVVITNPNAVAGTTFSWTLGTVTGTVSGQSAGSGTTISQTLTSALGGSVQYIITPIANGCPGTPLAPITVTVNPIPVGNSVAAGTHVICSGTSLNITPTLSVGSGTFTWSGSNGSGGSGNITDAPVNTTNSAINITYTVTPKGLGTTFCVGSPFTIVVTVNPNPSFTATNSAPTICSGVSTNILFNSSTTGHQINVVSVSYNGAGGGTVVPGTTTFANGNILTEALTNSTSAPIDVVYTFNVTTPSSSPVCPLVPVNQVVTVRVYPVPNALASSQSICSGSSSNVVITNPNAVAGTTFSWTLGTVTGTVSGQSAGSGTTISQTLTSALGGSVQYIITPIANGCPGTPLAPITVTVNPIPVGNSVAAGTHVICSGTSLNIVPTSNVAGATFTWSGSNGSGGSGNITDAPVNTTNSAINITYTVTPKGLGTTFCVGSPFTIVVTVNPNPSFTATNSTPTICSGVSTNILFNSSTTGHQINVVSVSYNGAGGGTVVPGTTTFANGNILTEALTNSTSAPIDVVYTFNVTTPSSSPVCPLVPVNQVVTVRVYPVPNALASSQSICSGSSSNVVITNPNAVAGTTFSWTLGTVTGTVSGQSAGSGTTISQTLTSALGGSVQYIITPIANGCPGTPLAPITVTVNPIPVGNSVAAGTHVICSGTSLNITPTLSVGSGTFTWSGSNGSGGSGNITDAPVNTTNSAINITYTVTPKGLGTTFCVGSPFTIVVTVNPNPSFTATNSTPTICSGVSTNILFNSSTTGHQINVVSVSYNGAGGGTVVPGTTTFANGNILTEALTNSTSAPIDVVYTFNVTTPSSSPVCPLVPVNQVVTVRVYPVPNALAITPQTICSGTTTNVVITNPNAVSGTTFTWTVVGASNVTGATTGSGALISQLLTSTDGISAGSLTYRITPSANGCAGASFDVTMNVTPKTVITNPATDFIKDICSATALNFIPTSSVSGTIYAWTSSVIGTLTGVSASGTGPITDTPVNATNTNAIIIYIVTPSFAGCAGNSINVVVTVHPVPTAAASNQLICSNSSPAIAISNPNAVAGTTYSWTVSSSTNATGATAGAGSTINQILTNVDGLTNGTVNYSVTPSANGCAGLPIIVTVTVKPIPVLTNTPTSFSQQICSGQALNFIPTASIAGTNFTWNSVITGTVSAGSVTASGTGPITDTPINIGNTSGTVRYTITPIINGCSGLPVDLIVTVKPLPSASGTNVTICSGENAIITISPTPVNVSGTTFSWTASPSANVIGAAGGNGSTISQILSTNNALVGTVMYSITPSANGCDGPITIVTANVNPKATANAGVDFSVCETLTFPATMTVPISGTIGGSATAGTWTVVSGTGSISSSTTTGTTVKATYTVGAGDIASQVTLRLTTNDPDVAGPCTVASDDLIINVNRRARVTLPSNFTACEPTSINLAGTLSGSATTGLWSLVTANTGTLSSSSITGSTVNASYLTAIPSDVTSTITFRLATNDPDGFGPCTSEFADINVHINESAKVNAGFGFEVCENQTVNLAGSYSGATSAVVWSGGSGSAQFGNINSAVTTYSLTPVDIAGGGITLTLKSNDPDGAGPCGIVSDQIFIKINKRPLVQIFNLNSIYAENDPQVTMAGVNNSVNGGTDLFTGPGVIAGTNIFDPANADKAPLINSIVYKFTDGVTGCSNSITKTVLVNQVTAINYSIVSERNATLTTTQICANVGRLHLIGDPEVTDPIALSASFSSVDIPARILKIGLEYFIDTDGLAPGNYLVTYTFTNTSPATETLTKIVTVAPAPKAVIDVGNNCIDGPVKFLESSFMTDGSPSSNIATYDWTYGEGSNGSSGPIAEPVYQYTTPGTHNITLKVTTGNGEFCSNITSKIINIGTPPVVDFLRSSFCKDAVTTFDDASTSTYGNINSYLWDFDDGGATSTLQNPSHTYSGFGTFDVKLTIGTDAGCTADSTKTIFIVDSPPPLVSSGYSTDFESGSGTWVSVIDYDLLGDKTSWQFGQPNGAEISTAASGTNAWWTGANNQSFYANEKSYVIGPCLNIQNLKRPMISLNYWSDTQKGFDGAVLQYSDDAGLSWKPIGNANDEGIYWYNSRDLPGRPGGQDNFAWSDTLGGWRNARFNLEEIDVTKRDLIVFRIAFGSNTDNTGRKYNGFAFDDIYIGEKKRNVLVEHFTNSGSVPSGQADDYLDDLYSRSLNFNGRDSSDVINLQYHIANPGKDPINADNQDDPNARRLRYGVSQPPFTVMDGIVGPYYNTNFNGSYAYITDQEVDRRALEDPAFNITIDTLATNNNTISLSIRYTYVDPTKILNTPVILQAALVESGVNGKKNYLRKLLLQAEGKYINKTWSNGTQEVVAVNYTIDVPIAYPNSLSIIAFVQDKEIEGDPKSGRILQSAIRKISKKIGSTVVGVEDDPALAEIVGLNIYPNPVSNTLNLQLENNLHNDYAWKMIDQRGVVVLEGNLNRDLTSPQKVDVSRLADGIYFMAIQSGDKSLVYRKIAVINRN